MSTFESDFDALVDAFLPFAVEMLTKYGNLEPFGGAMEIDGKIGMHGAYTGDEPTAALDLIHLLKDGLIQQAQAGRLKATAMFFEVTTSLPDSVAQTDAIAILLDHRDGPALAVYFPYAIEDEQVHIGDYFVRDGDVAIFPERHALQ